MEAAVHVHLRVIPTNLATTSLFLNQPQLTEDCISRLLMNHHSGVLMETHYQKPSFKTQILNFQLGNSLSKYI